MQQLQQQQAPIHVHFRDFAPWDFRPLPRSVVVSWWTFEKNSKGFQGFGDAPQVPRPYYIDIYSYAYIWLCIYIYRGSRISQVPKSYSYNPNTKLTLKMEKTKHDGATFSYMSLILDFFCRIFTRLSEIKRVKSHGDWIDCLVTGANFPCQKFDAWMVTSRRFPYYTLVFKIKPSALIDRLMFWDKVFVGCKMSGWVIMVHQKQIPEVRLFGEDFSTPTKLLHHLGRSAEVVTNLPNHCQLSTISQTIPWDPCMVYLLTFTLKINQMWINIPHMDPMEYR